MSDEKITSYQYAELTKSAKRSLGSSWPTAHDLPPDPKRRGGKRRRTGKPKQKKLGVNKRAKLHGWNRWKRPYLAHFSTMHQRVSEAAGMDFGRGVQGPFGKIIGDPSR